MKPLGYSAIDRFDPHALFHPRRVLLSGAETPLGARLRAALDAAAFEGEVVTAADAAAAGGRDVRSISR